ncbi:MAG: hypothetical protein CME19_11520 [Gemmatimonadetes bacterium]|nr:hypothetical protein [Gemmatimonadota bacterium]
MAAAETATDDRATLNGLLVGSVFVAWINFWISYAEYIVHASRMNISHYPVALFISYFVLAASIPLVRRVSSRFSLSSGNMALILAMGMVGAMVPTSGLMGFFLGIIATPFYFATAENRWGEFFHPHIPEWVAPRDYGYALTWFFDGPPGGPVEIPWSVWITPIFWWLILIGAVVYASAAIASILRKPWSEHERLVYPLVSATQDLIHVGDVSRKRFFWHEKLFWVGLAVPVVLMIWNFLVFLFPLLPFINTQGRWLAVARGFPSFRTRLNFFTLGFAYLANLEVLFSIWVFYLITSAEVWGLNRVGFKITGTEDSWCSIDAASGWQSFGGLTAMVLWGLWVARGHLRDVWGGVVDRKRPQGEEILTYRGSVVGLGVSVLIIVFWMKVAGMSLGLAVLLLFATFIVTVGVARIVSESGLIYVRAPMTPQVFSIYAIGPGNLSSQALTISAFSYAFFSQGKGLFMGPMMHTTKLAEQVRNRKSLFAGALFLSIAVGLSVCTGLTFSWGYDSGAYNFSDYPFSSGSKHAFNATINKIRDTRGMDFKRLGFFGAGTIVMSVLLFLRYRLPWWPLHPIGFTIPLTYPTRNSVFAILIAWICKSVVLRFGGVSLYDRTRPICLGIVVGYALGVGLSFLGDYIWFFGDGHGVHSW